MAVCAELCICALGIATRVFGVVCPFFRAVHFGRLCALCERALLLSAFEHLAFVYFEYPTRGFVQVTCAVVQLSTRAFIRALSLFVVRCHSELRSTSFPQLGIWQSRMSTNVSFCVLLLRVCVCVLVVFLSPNSNLFSNSQKAKFQIPNACHKQNSQPPYNTSFNN